MALGNAPGDGEPDAEAAGGAGRVRPVKPVKELAGIDAPGILQRLDTRSATNPSTSSVQIASAARDHTSTIRTERRA